MSVHRGCRTSSSTQTSSQPSAKCSSATGCFRRRPREKRFQSSSVTDALRVLPLGGLGEIGKNMTVVEYGGRIVVVDTGLMFPTPEQLGIDLVLPDFSYLRERQDDIEAIVLTHGHEDHVGALPFVLRELDDPPPIYGGPLTAARGASWLRASHRTSTACSRSWTPRRRSAEGCRWWAARCARTSTSARASATSRCPTGCCSGRRRSRTSPTTRWS